MNRNGILAIVDDKGREKERYQVVYGAKILVEDGAPVQEQPWICSNGIRTRSRF